MGGILLERIVIRPVANAPILTIVIVRIGLLVILNSVAGWIYTYTSSIGAILAASSAFPNGVSL